MDIGADEFLIGDLRDVSVVNLVIDGKGFASLSDSFISNISIRHV
jgi:hypothetical protein